MLWDAVQAWGLRHIQLGCPYAISLEWLFPLTNIKRGHREWGLLL